MVTILIVAAVSGWLCAGAGWYCFRRKNGKHLMSTPTPFLLSDWDRRLMAYHEAGHAVVSHFSPEREPLLLITIDPTLETFGQVKTAPRRRLNDTRISLSSAVSVALAGRLAEEIFLHEVTTSCIHDLAEVRHLAQEMVIRFGMSPEIGLLQLKSTEDSEFILSAGTLGNAITEAIRTIIEQGAENARTLLAAHASEVVALAEMLLERKTLTREEIKDFFIRHGATGAL